MVPALNWLLGVALSGVEAKGVALATDKEALVHQPKRNLCAIMKLYVCLIRISCHQGQAPHRHMARTFHPNPQ